MSIVVKPTFFSRVLWTDELDELKIYMIPIKDYMIKEVFDEKDKHLLDYTDCYNITEYRAFILLSIWKLGDIFKKMEMLSKKFIKGQIHSDVKKKTLFLNYLTQSSRDFTISSTSNHLDFVRRMRKKYVEIYKAK
jgi:hypothetical protein